MPKEPFGQALTYLRNQLEHLLVYLDDGLMPIENNETEQLMKQMALGRKNWMFIGSVAADFLCCRSHVAGGGRSPFQSIVPLALLLNPFTPRVFRNSMSGENAAYFLSGLLLLAATLLEGIP